MLYEVDYLDAEMHISQLLGYSRIANPLFSFLISTKGIGPSVKAFLLRYDRTDVLEYNWDKGRQPRSIILATWNEHSRQIDMASLLPPGAAASVR